MIIYDQRTGGFWRLMEVLSFKKKLPTGGFWQLIEVLSF